MSTSTFLMNPNDMILTSLLGSHNVHLRIEMTTLGSQASVDLEEVHAWSFVSDFLLSFFLVVLGFLHRAGVSKLTCFGASVLDFVTPCQWKLVGREGTWKDSLGVIRPFAFVGFGCLKSSYRTHENYQLSEQRVNTTADGSEVPSPDITHVNT